MSGEYRFHEHTADVLFTVKADSLEELFRQCGLALEDSMINITKVMQTKKVIITVNNKNLEGLLFDFLDDLLFYKDSELLVFSDFRIEIEKIDKGYKLFCEAKGDKLDVSKHDPKVDVKAITMHMFEIKKKDEGWFAQVLVDI